ncbi:hypothetical protein [Brenneria rubrifaciens]|uniref:Uncharacterized protein n=1 Tax=Brenneria rubrifaciens TaxID=55213 RepID=A0A4P8QTD8_9GAMM|nr:hypothetical protein [Brenneria rubrifaciens]QCR07415.1 hypothetical protein EH207_01900 [Brenneria rubrifaciens]
MHNPDNKKKIADLANKDNESYFKEIIIILLHSIGIIYGFHDGININLYPENRSSDNDKLTVNKVGIDEIKRNSDKR